jgi:hypothetical protein
MIRRFACVVIPVHTASNGGQPAFHDATNEQSRQ